MINRITQKWIVVVISGAIMLLFFIGSVGAQSLDVAYVATPDSIVDRMLDIANVGPGDYVIDLGCGDGRINIAAAKRGALGYGVDLDPQRIAEAQANAEKAGVADKIVFEVKNVYETDFSRASVIAMYLFPSINVKLRPAFLETLEPGTRIVSHDFGMDEWEPDLQVGRMENHAVLLWILPAKVSGIWSWQTDGTEFEMRVSQEFQKIEVQLNSRALNFEVSDVVFSGKRISFAVANSSGHKKYVFNGTVNDQKIDGIVLVHDENGTFVENWSATTK